jgi:hypothetical protein
MILTQDMRYVRPVDLPFVGSDDSIDSSDLAVISAVISEVKSYFGPDMETTRPCRIHS